MDLHLKMPPLYLAVHPTHKTIVHDILVFLVGVGCYKNIAKLEVIAVV